MEKFLCTAEEAGKALGVGRTSVYELIKQGRLQSITIGRSRRIPTDALRQFVEDELSQQGNA